MMKCSVCIPTYHRPSNLNALLASILAMDDARIDEVIVGITGKEEESINQQTEQLQKAFDLAGKDLWFASDLTGICCAKKLFKNYARNEVMLFCDDDGLFNRDYLDLLMWFNDPFVGAVSGSLQTPLNVGGYKDWCDRPIRISPDVHSCNTLKLNEETGGMDWSDKYQVYMVEGGKAFKCQYLIGTCLFVRKSALEIDMAFEQGACAGEEIDFTYNMYLNGYWLIFDSSRVAWHLHSMVGGNRNVDRSKDDKNMTYLVRKYGLGNEVKGETVYE